MDGRLAILFGVMGLFGDHTELAGFNMDRGDISGHVVASMGPTLRNGQYGSLETRLSYALPHKWGRFNPMVDISVSDAGAVWAGVGLYQQFDFDIGNQDMFFGFYFAPGLYHAGNDIDLGLPLEFRSGMEVGFQLKNDWQVSLSYDHRSNADFVEINPGVETIQLRFSKPFGG